MQDTLTIFKDEVQNLLSEYFVKDDFEELFIDPTKSSNDESDISSKIGDLYRRQLDIRIEETFERIQIDRTITFAEKNLEREKFFEFTLDLANICIVSGKMNLAQEIFNKVNKKTGVKTLKAKSLIGLAEICSRNANWTRSISLVTEAETIYKETNDKAGIANCFNLLGSISGELGDIEKAKNYFGQSLSILIDTSEKELNAKIETNLGVVNSILGNKDEAIDHLESALIIYKEAGDLRRVSESYLNLGLNYLHSGNTIAAVSTFDKGIEIALEDHYFGILALLYLAKSELLLAIKDIRMARDFADKALSISHTLDDKLTIADIYKVRGIIAREMNDTQTAESYLMISLRINAKLGNNLNMAETSTELGILYKKLNNQELSVTYLTHALDYYKKYNAVDKVSKIEKLLKLSFIQSNENEVQNEC
jgi:tetratricopeptide (TPR) repeat protein